MIFASRCPPATHKCLRSSWVRQGVSWEAFWSEKSILAGMLAILAAILCEISSSWGVLGGSWEHFWPSEAAGSGSETLFGAERGPLEDFWVRSPTRRCRNEPGLEAQGKGREGVFGFCDSPQLTFCRYLGEPTKTQGKRRFLMILRLSRRLLGGIVE